MKLHWTLTYYQMLLCIFSQWFSKTKLAIYAIFLCSVQYFYLVVVVKYVFLPCTTRVTDIGYWGYPPWLDYIHTSTVYWCMASNLKALRNLILNEKKSMYVWVYLFAIYVLYLCTEEALSSSNCLDHDDGTKDSKTWFVYCTVWWVVIHM